MPRSSVPFARCGSVPFPGCAAILLCVLLAANAYGISIEIIPPSPTDRDHVIVKVSGSRPDGCWEFVGHECLPVENHRMAINVYWLDHWEPGAGCPAWVVEYEVYCGYGVLEGGNYIVTVSEYNDSQRNPETNIQIFEFEVESPIAADAASWGKIKNMYR